MRPLTKALTVAALPILAFALLANSAQERIDPTTGRPARGFVPPAQVASPNPTTSQAGVDLLVLWDLTHGVDFGYEPAQAYSGLTAQLEAQGLHVTTTAAGIENVDLAPYSVLVLCNGSSLFSSYTPSEANVAKQFVQNGGGLLLMGDNSGTANTLKAVARAFSTATNRTTISPPDLTFSQFSDHAIFAGIHSLYFRAAGAIRGAPPSVPVAWTDLGEPVINVVSGQRVVVLGDINGFENDYFDIADNRAFATNVFRFLAGL